MSRHHYKRWGQIIVQVRPDGKEKIVPHDCGALLCDESADGTLRCARCDGDRSDEVQQKGAPGKER